MTKQASKRKQAGRRVVTTHSNGTRSINFREAVDRQIKSKKFASYKKVRVASS